jgi:Ran GTPase-activating protein (RanGAP) involved in mRNA processing and transport
MKRNDIGLSGCQEMESCLTASKTVRVLDFSGNNIGDEGVKILVNAL